MISFPEYVNEISHNIYNFGGDGSVVFNSSVSNAIISCYDIMREYARVRQLKNIPSPVSVVCKIPETPAVANYTALKFNVPLNLDSIYGCIESLGLEDDVNVTEYSSCLILEIIR